MGKHIVCWVTSICVLTFTGCYQMRQVTMDDFMENHHPSEAYFHASDSLVYHAGKYGYQVANDSLIIHGLQVRPDKSTVPYRGSILVNSVSRVDVSAIDKTATGLLLGGMLVGGIVIFLVKAGQSIMKAGSNIGRGWG